ncbi:hypothetical protein KFL_001030120 [Klebsormidium nitens]|uniref:Uncharacterized protein n=1 Tax=Klebsormidium nitens TaxID=105231 RepID=A0A1Y1I081_KLENI|nr:hypothetical protein KFL_001030120 [Klebsormidium nitens]|eukprot:GAQ82187.1 hypothetical protein KFL_001030120 [Klebsormidium nitens]
MGGLRTVRSQTAVDMDGFPAFSGEIKGGGSVLVFAITTASKAAKRLDRLHFHGLPKLRKNISLGKLLAQLAGSALSNTVWSIRTVRTILAFALLVILMRQTFAPNAGGRGVSQRNLDWMADFGPRIDAGYFCSRHEANQSLVISSPQHLKRSLAPSAGLFLSPPPPNKAHLESPPPTLSWFGLRPSTWTGESSPIEMLPVDCEGSAPDKFYCCSEVRKLMGALRGAGVTSAGGLTQCMSQVKSMLAGHVTIDTLGYCGVDVNEYVSPSRVEHVLTMLRPEAYGHEPIALKDDQFTLPDRVVQKAQSSGLRSRRLTLGASR